MEDFKTSKGLSLCARKIIANIVLILITFFCLIWFFILFINATKSNGELTRGFTPVPSTHLIENWLHLIHGTLPVLRGMLNSIIISVCCAAISVYFSTLTAYAIHAYDFKAKKFMETFILAVMMIPTQVTALGFLQLVGKMKMDDTFWPLIIPAAAAPVTYFYMKQYMVATLPSAIIESARIDGAGEFCAFNSIVVPMMKPAVAVQAIFTFVSNWNNYFVPTLILHTDTKKTLPILIAQLRSADFLKFDMGQVYVMIAFAILPVIVVYLCLSKFIVGGVTLGGVKG